MRKLMRVSPAALLVLVACGSRGTHDDEPGEISPAPACEVDEDCGDGAICFDGTCTELGDTTPPTTTAPETAPTSTDAPSTTTGPDDLGELSGVWIGYVENYSFDSGSDVVRLEIHAGDCSPTATLTLGEGEPLPPVTDPDVGYPEGITAHEIPWLRPYEGYAYAATTIEISERRVQLTTNNGQVWEEWCQLQEPVQVSEEEYSCVAARSWSFDGEQCFINTEEELIPDDCGHLTLCAYQTCRCDASGCEANAIAGLSLDVALDDDHLEGTLAGVGDVRFYREE